MQKRMKERYCEETISNKSSAAEKKTVLYESKVKQGQNRQTRL